MRVNLMTRAAVAIFVVALVMPVWAHHGNAAFDNDKRVTMKGTVTEWYWANPHCFLQFEVKDDSDNVTRWVAEASNPPDMINHGWSKNVIKVGDQVTVTVIPVKNGKPIGRITAVVLPGGQTLDGGFGAPPARNAGAANTSGSPK